jgi:hypothetical protein
MKLYEIKSVYDISYVVAKNYAEVERIFKGKYWSTRIISIKHISDNVQVQDFDEKKKEDGK